jgi:hypothetical protein
MLESVANWSGMSSEEFTVALFAAAIVIYFIVLQSQLETRVDSRQAQIAGLAASDEPIVIALGEILKDIELEQVRQLNTIKLHKIRSQLRERFSGDPMYDTLELDDLHKLMIQILLKNPGKTAGKRKFPARKRMKDGVRERAREAAKNGTAEWWQKETEKQAGHELRAVTKKEAEELACVAATDRTEEQVQSLMDSTAAALQLGEASALPEIFTFGGSARNNGKWSRDGANEWRDYMRRNGDVASEFAELSHNVFARLNEFAQAENAKHFQLMLDSTTLAQEQCLAAMKASTIDHGNDSNGFSNAFIQEARMELGTKVQHRSDGKAWCGICCRPASHDTCDAADGCGHVHHRLCKDELVDLGVGDCAQCTPRDRVEGGVARASTLLVRSSHSQDQEERKVLVHKAFAIMHVVGRFSPELETEWASLAMEKLEKNAPD